MDLMLLNIFLSRFYEPVTFQPNILPVCVPANDEGFVGKTAYVTGWGRLYEGTNMPIVTPTPIPDDLPLLLPPATLPVTMSFSGVQRLQSILEHAIGIHLPCMPSFSR